MPSIPGRRTWMALAMACAAVTACGGAGAASIASGGNETLSVLADEAARIGPVPLFSGSPSMQQERGDPDGADSVLEAGYEYLGPRRPVTGATVQRQVDAHMHANGYRPEVLWSWDCQESEPVPGPRMCSRMYVSSTYETVVTLENPSHAQPRAIMRVTVTRLTP